MRRVLKDHRVLSKLTMAVFLTFSTACDAYAGEEDKNMSSNTVSSVTTKMDAEKARKIAQKCARKYESAKWRLKKGEYESCLELIEQIQSDVKQPQLKLKCDLLKSQALLELEKYQEALDLVNGLALENPEILFCKAKALIGVKHLDEAKTALRKVVAQRSRVQGGAYFTLALLHKDNGEPGIFELMLSDAELEKFVIDVRLTVLSELMWYYMRNNELTLLNETYSRHAKKAENRAGWGVSMTRRNLAGALEKNGADDALALKVLSDLANSDLQKPCSPLWNAEAHLRCGDIYLRNNNLVKAKEEYRKCLNHPHCDKRIGGQAKKMLDAL